MFPHSDEILIILKANEFLFAFILSSFSYVFLEQLNPWQEVKKVVSSLFAVLSAPGFCLSPNLPLTSYRREISIFQKV